MEGMVKGGLSAVGAAAVRMGMPAAQKSEDSVRNQTHTKEKKKHSIWIINMNHKSK